ncbi:MAG: cupin domain-containing protein [Candidatus Aenigmarchaeota archaeon]|nr:cupin domain-containing protein [Candidatus Aenigmarchaeota archaeon]
MFVRKLKDCKEIVAGDNCILRELLGKKDNIVNYSLAKAIVKPGDITYKHKLKESSEVYYILEGDGLMYIDNETKEVGSGDTIYIPHNSVQRIKNTGDKNLVFLCIVEPAWCPEDEKILE